MLLRPCLRLPGAVALLGVLLAAPLTRAEVSARDRKLVEDVAARLLAVIDRPDGYDVWPPVIDVEDNPVPNAYACLVREEYGKGRFVPKLVIFTGEIIQVAQRDPDVLALTVGHELGHIVLKHIMPRGEKPILVQKAFGRTQELEADEFGMRAALKAGYSRSGILSNLTGVRRTSQPYSSLEGLVVGHPAWAERAAILDEKNRKVWQSMSAFQSGVFFLMVEQYVSAARAFEKVVDAYPGCYEAQANRGYALLMYYCDQLDAKDLARFDVAFFVVGGFYRRVSSLEKELRRGEDVATWKEAVAALEKALELNPGLSLAKANLGLAYLVRPTMLGGKDVQKALQLFQEAAALAGKDADLDPVLRAVILCNTGVAYLSADRYQDGARTLGEAERLYQGLRTGKVAMVSADTLGGALVYNQALLKTSSKEEKDRREAVKLFEEYLKATSPASAWWTVAHDRYSKLSRELGLEPKKPEDLARSASGKDYRPVVSLQVKDVQLTLGDKGKDAEEAFGKPGASIPMIPRSQLKRKCYPELGIAILSNDFEVVAIYLLGDKAPPLPIEVKGLGGAKQMLRVGMTVEELEQLIGKSIDYTSLDVEDVYYRYYYDLGVAVCIRKGKVAELVLARVPRERGS